MTVHPDCASMDKLSPSSDTCKEPAPPERPAAASHHSTVQKLLHLAAGSAHVHARSWADNSVQKSYCCRRISGESPLLTLCGVAHFGLLQFLLSPVHTLLEPVQVLITTQAAMAQVRDGSAAGIAKELGAIHFPSSSTKHVFLLF